MAVRRVAACHDFPGQDPIGGNVGPYVDLGHHIALGGNIYLGRIQLLEAMRAAVEPNSAVPKEVLSASEKDGLVKLLGGASPLELGELRAQNQDLIDQLAYQTQNKYVKLGEVLDYIDAQKATA